MSLPEVEKPYRYYLACAVVTQGGLAFISLEIAIERPITDAAMLSEIQMGLSRQHGFQSCTIINFQRFEEAKLTVLLGRSNGMKVA